MDVEVMIIKYAIDGEGNPLGNAVLNHADAQKEPAREPQDKR